MMHRLVLFKRYFLLFCFLMLPLLLCGCQKHQHIVTSTGEVGHRAENLQKMMYTGGTKHSNSNSSKAGIIYLGRDYENNQFGPPKLKFVFEK